jgi:uncharacterized protein YjbJ (UPF0337 family)
MCKFHDSIRLVFHFARLASRASHPDIFHVAFAKRVVAGAIRLARAVQVPMHNWPSHRAARGNLTRQIATLKRRPVMNAQTLKGSWHIAKGKLKQKYANLTDNDLRYIEGKEEELIGRIQKVTGARREEIERLLADNEDFNPGDNL